MLAISIFILTASAAELHEGMRGKTYGQILKAEEFPTCKEDPKTEDTWFCQEELAGLNIQTAYSSHPTIGLYSILLLGNSYVDCAKLRNIIGQAWGRGQPQSEYLNGSMDDWRWKSNGVVGTFEYNQYSKECQVVTLDIAKYKKKDAEDQEKAKEAAAEL
jgi:hypothetical protein